jgi:hypothetical protein
MSSVKISFLSFPELEPSRPPGLCFWSGAFLLLAVVHSPPARMVATFHFGTEPGWVLARTWVCAVALTLLALSLVPDLWRYARANSRWV